MRTWNATTTALEAKARVEQWVTRQAERTPDAVAVIAGDIRLDYRALEARANRFAQCLRQRGVGAGDLVGLCLGRGPDLLPALLGVLKTGAAYVPLDPGFPRDRLQYMAEDAGVKLVVTEAAHADRSGVDRARQLRIDDDAALIDAAPETKVIFFFCSATSITAKATLVETSSTITSTPSLSYHSRALLAAMSALFW